MEKKENLILYEVITRVVKYNNKKIKRRKKWFFLIV